MATGQRDLEGSTCLDLAANLGQIRSAVDAAGDPAGRCVPSHAAVSLEEHRLRQFHPWRHGTHSAAPVRPQKRHRIGQARCRHDLQTFCQRSLCGSFFRYDHAPHPPPRQGGHHRQQARNRAQIAAERQFPQNGPSAYGLDLLGADHDSQGDGQVQGGAALAEICRSKIHGDSTRWVFISAVTDCAPDSLARFLQRGVRQSHDRKPGQTGRHIDLDSNDPAVEAVDSCRKERRKHAAQATRARSTAAYLRLPDQS